MTIKSFSYGGGVQSTAALVLAAQGKIDVDVFLFADVGADSENPGTVEYVESVARPYARENGIRLETVRYTVFKEPATLLEELGRRKSSYVIPVHFEKSGMGRRKCTYDFKIAPIARWLKEAGATPDDPAVVSLGISTDEMQRMRTSSGFDHYTLSFPLVDLRLFRDQCEEIIRDAGLPVPPKSSCFFCPFHSLGQWRQLHREDPASFEKAVELEKMLSDRMQKKQGTPVYLSGQRRPLPDLIGTHEQASLLDDEDTCESGYCMT